jgi:hypothetical protein
MSPTGTGKGIDTAIRGITDSTGIEVASRDQKNLTND